MTTKKVAFLLIVTMLTLTLTLTVNAPSGQACLPLLGRRILLDPGHGGIDPGACYFGQQEKAIVLEISYHLRDLLVAAGAEVRFTRSTDRDLADQLPVERAASRKRRDIMRRVELANAWQPDVVISLHLNAIDGSRWRGAQVFHQQRVEQSEQLAKVLQAALTRVLQNTTRQPQAGDYRLLNDTKSTAVLLELGFISNPDEAKLLADHDYQQQLVWAILVGLLNWWNG